MLGINPLKLLFYVEICKKCMCTFYTRVRGIYIPGRYIIQIVKYEDEARQKKPESLLFCNKSMYTRKQCLKMLKIIKRKEKVSKIVLESLLNLKIQFKRV